MNANTCHSVALLDAIPEGELNTARRLREDLRDLAISFSPVPVIQYFRLEAREDFVNAIHELRGRVVNEGLLPLIHFEGHGCIDGVLLANGNPLSWKEFKEALIPLNEAMGLNLMLVLAACYGGTFIRAMNTIERAPVWGLIGPKKEVKTCDVQSSFGAFYAALFRGEGGSSAIEALNRSVSGRTYYRTSAERFFYEVWCQYQRHECTKSKYKERARLLRKRMKTDGQIQKLPSVGQLKRHFRSEESSQFEKYRDIYFMFDLYPSNRGRFTVTYKKAMRRCQR